MIAITEKEFPMFIDVVDQMKKDFLEIDGVARECLDSQEAFVSWIGEQGYNIDWYTNYSSNIIYLLDETSHGKAVYVLVEFDAELHKDIGRSYMLLFCSSSSWDNRYKIMNQSLGNLKEWFLSIPDAQVLTFTIVESGFHYLNFLFGLFDRYGFVSFPRNTLRWNKEQIPDTCLMEGYQKIPYSPEYHEQIQSVYATSDTEQLPEKTREFNYIETYLATVEDLLDQEDLASTMILVTDQYKRLVGFSHYCCEENQRHIDYVYVLPEHQKRGLGKFLLSEIMKLIQHEKPDGEITLSTGRNNKPAMNLYYSYGFRTVYHETKYQLYRSMLQEITG